MKAPSSTHAPAESDCIFCQLNNTELNKIFSQNETCYARLDNFPAAHGHLEIVPKRHVVSFFDLQPNEVNDVFRLMSDARKKLSQEYEPDGYTIGVNEGEAAGRTVHHLHIHLIPRYAGDVADPRGGVRNVIPGCSPDLWS